MSDLYKEDGERFFSASNTKDGFVSYFEDVFSEDDVEKLYILKGGPGVGKSTFMKNLGTLAQNKGLSCEYFHCSSDPCSLDGIIIKEKKTAVIDGTSPHAVEPRLAGAREIIINLGAAWNTDMLFENKDILKALSKKKSDFYNDGYKYLKAKSVMDELIYNLVFPNILFDKLHNGAKRLSKSLFGSFKQKKESKQKIRLVSAVSTVGRIRLSSFEDAAKMCVFVKEPFAGSKLASLFISDVCRNARSCGLDVIIGFNPEIKGQINAIYLPEIGVSVTEFDEKLVENCDKRLKKCRIVNTARFVDKNALSSVKPLRKFYAKLSQSMETLALDSFEKAGKVHMETEKIYRPCTNYETVEKISQEYFDKILQ